MAPRPGKGPRFYAHLMQLLTSPRNCPVSPRWTHGTAYRPRRSIVFRRAVGYGYQLTRRAKEGRPSRLNAALLLVLPSCDATAK